MLSAIAPCVTFHWLIDLHSISSYTFIKKILFGDFIFIVFYNIDFFGWYKTFPSNSNAFDILLRFRYCDIFSLYLNIWMYFATLLKTTAPVKLPISQLSLLFNLR